jgi:acyl-CoA oxidase
MAYMANYRICFNSSPCTSHGSDFLSTDILRRIFEHRASRLTSEAQEMLKSSELSNSAAWNKNMMPLISAARAHIDVHVLKAYTFQVSSLPPSPTRDVLSKLVSLYGLTTIIAPDSNNAISFVLDGHLSHSQLSEMREQVDVLLEQLLPDSIALTDAWQFTDASLASTIGCKDGNAYERIMLWTRQPPINLNAKANGGVFKEGWDRYIGPVIRAKL